MKYYSTDIELMIGDRVIYRHFFVGQTAGTVAFIPGTSDAATAKRYDTDEWVVDLDSGKSVFMAFGPDLEYTHRRIQFVERSLTRPAK